MLADAPPTRPGLSLAARKQTHPPDPAERVVPQMLPLGATYETGWIGGVKFPAPYGVGLLHPLSINASDRPVLFLDGRNWQFRTEKSILIDLRHGACQPFGVLPEIRTQASCGKN